MTFSVSAVVLFGIVAVVLVRGRYAGPGTAAVLFLFGFFTAGTGAYGPIQNLCQALVHALRSFT